MIKQQANQSGQVHEQEQIRPPFNPLKVIIPVLIALLSVSLMAQWYANNVSMPRYCKKPQQTLRYLSQLLDNKNTITTEQRRQTMIAAKLLYLHPQKQSESKGDYLRRLRYLMLNQCAESIQ